MMKIWLAAATAFMAVAASQAQAEDESLLGSVPQGAEALAALPGAELSEPETTEDGGQSLVLSYQGGKIRIHLAQDGSQTAEPADPAGNLPVLCVWQMAIMFEAARKPCAEKWGETAVSAEMGAEALSSIERYIQENNVVPVTADYVSAERERQSQVWAKELEQAASENSLDDACASAGIYGIQAFKHMEDNGPPLWQQAIQTPAPVITVPCD